MEVYFVLDEHGEPQLERDLDVWSRWFENADRTVVRTAVTPEVMVLTTFRGVDESPAPDNQPRLFETRIFGGVLDGEEVCRSTRSEAVAAHSALVEWCRIGNEPDVGVNEKLIA